MPALGGPEGGAIRGAALNVLPTALPSQAGPLLIDPLSLREVGPDGVDAGVIGTDAEALIQLPQCVQVGVPERAAEDAAVLTVAFIELVFQPTNLRAVVG